jgi:Zn-dependent protease
VASGNAEVTVVFFLEPSETQFDFRFRLFGIRVRVSPWFWVMCLVLGWGGAEHDRQHFLQRLLIWTACVFVSILVHEVGHVVVGRLFGSHGHIVLYSMGGLAVGSNALERRWQRVAVCAAGPAAGFLLLGLVVGGVHLSGVAPRNMPEMARLAYGSLLWINLAWGLINLLPIWPLDGGQISRDVCRGLGRDRGVRTSLGLSTVVAGLIAVHALALELSPGYGERVRGLVESWGRWSVILLGLGGWYIALFFGMLALGSFAALRQMEQQQRWSDKPWDEDS